AARYRALRPHDEAVADPQEQHTDEGILGDLTRLWDDTVPQRRETRHDDAGRQEPQARSCERGHLPDDDANGKVRRAPDEVDSREGDPGPERGAVLSRF